MSGASFIFYVKIDNTIFIFDNQNQFTSLNYTFPGIIWNL